MSRFSCFTGFTGRRLAGRIVNNSIIGTGGNRAASVLTTLFVLALLLFCGCAKGPGDPLGPGEYGMLEVSVRMVNQPLKKSAAAEGFAQTVAENLIVEISGIDLSPTQFKLKLDPTRPTVVDTVKNVPIGEARRISVWAVNKNGDKTHIDSIEYRYTDVERAKVTRIYATLVPAAGSIYLHINGVEGVSTIHASFTSRDGELVFQNSVKREAKTFLSIDNVPHEMDGVLRVSLVDAKGDTVKVATNEFIFNARKDNVIELQFIENSGMLGMDAALYAPGVTMLSYDFATSVSNVAETGELIITEIMFSAGNDNYIELYNPKDVPVSFDTLTTEIEKTTHKYIDVMVEAKSYFVISRQAASYASVNANTVGGLPITATGNWISVRRGKTGAVIDRVVCGGTNSTIGWPAGLSSSSKRSIELNRDKYDVMENNFGKNWSAASQPIGGTGMFGTPGK
jgi:hypothetical protein